LKKLGHFSKTKHKNWKNAEIKQKPRKHAGKRNNRTENLPQNMGPTQKASRRLCGLGAALGGI
jgi:hypothetical protein